MPDSPYDILASRSADFLLSLSALHGHDASRLGRETIEVITTSTIGYLMTAAERAGVANDLATILAQITVETD